jgi:hypothetical protein
MKVCCWCVERVLFGCRKQEKEPSLFYFISFILSSCKRKKDDKIKEDTKWTSG